LRRVCRGMRGCDGGLRRGLEADFDEVKWVANKDPDGTGDVPGPEVGGHRVLYLKLSRLLELMADGTPFMLGPHIILWPPCVVPGDRVRRGTGLSVDSVWLLRSGHTSLPGASELAIWNPKTNAFVDSILACYCAHRAIVMMWRGISLGISAAPQEQQTAVIGRDRHVSGAVLGVLIKRCKYSICENVRQKIQI
jgi:hypothetical protein